jgi:hypothetical protein
MMDRRTVLISVTLISVSVLPAFPTHLCPLSQLEEAKMNDTTRVQKEPTVQWGKMGTSI